MTTKANHSIQRTGASRSAQSKFVAQWPLAPAAHAQRWPFNMRAFAAGVVAGFVIAASAWGAEKSRSDAGAPAMVLRFADAYVTSLPEQEKEGHQSDLRDMFVSSFFWGFVMPNAKLTSGNPVDFAGDAAGRQYRLSNPDKLKEIMQGFGYTATNAQGNWRVSFEHSVFKLDGQSDRGWWLRPMDEPDSQKTGRDVPSDGGPVRISGFLSPKGRYGHLGACEYQFFATNISLVKIGQSEGPAKGSQPSGSEANRTPGAAGSGR